MTDEALEQPQVPQLVFTEQPEGVRFWVREDTDYYASFQFEVLDGPMQDYTPIAGFNSANEAHHYAELMEKANQPDA